MTVETITVAAQAANLLADAVRAAQQAANKDDHRLLELALREPLRQARALEAALAEIAEAAAQRTEEKVIVSRELLDDTLEFLGIAERLDKDTDDLIFTLQRRIEASLAEAPAS